MATVSKDNSLSGAVVKVSVPVQHMFSRDWGGGGIILQHFVPLRDSSPSCGVIPHNQEDTMINIVFLCSRILPRCRMLENVKLCGCDGFQKAHFWITSFFAFQFVNHLTFV